MDDDQEENIVVANFSKGMATPRLRRVLGSGITGLRRVAVVHAPPCVDTSNTLHPAPFNLLAKEIGKSPPSLPPSPLPPLTPQTNPLPPKRTPTHTPTASRILQYWLDKSTIHVLPRWVVFTFLVFIFSLRIYSVQAYFIVAYGLGIYLLNNFIAFLSPLEDPLGDPDDGSPGLPNTNSEAREFRPFARRLPEFKFWLACSKGTCVAFMMTFFSMFDVPVFWPILLM